MTYSSDLLDSADSLIAIDATKPRKANLDRAVSAAYYAAFHAICDGVAARVGGTNEVRASVRRAVGHKELRVLCNVVRQGAFPSQPAFAWRGENVGGDLRDLARLFVQLQDARPCGRLRPLDNIDVDPSGSAQSRPRCTTLPEPSGPRPANRTGKVVPPAAARL